MQFVLQVVLLVLSAGQGTVALKTDISAVFKKLAEFGSEEMRRMEAHDQEERKVTAERRAMLNSDFLANVKLEGLT